MSNADFASRDPSVAPAASVTGSRFPRLESTLSGATGVRVGAPARGWYFAIGLLVIGGVAIATVVVQLAGPSGSGAPGPRLPAPPDADLEPPTPPVR